MILLASRNIWRMPVDNYSSREKRDKYGRKNLSQKRNFTYEINVLRPVVVATDNSEAAPHPSVTGN